MLVALWVRFCLKALCEKKKNINIYSINIYSINIYSINIIYNTKHAHITY